MTYEECRAELLDYGKFERGWDGYRAEKFTQATLKKTEDILRSCENSGFPAPELCPCPDGSIDIEWDGVLASVDEFGNVVTQYQ